MTHVLVIGAGPAGLAAAVAASDSGADVTLVDSSRDIGGQYWRSLPRERERESTHDGGIYHGFSRLLAFRTKVENSQIDLWTRSSVWSIEPTDATRLGLAVNVSTGPADGIGRDMHCISPDAVVFATGAHDRTLPFPGWDLPGVYTGGAAQSLAKAEQVRIGDRVIVSGAGPFLLPVASSLLATGSEVEGVYEAARPARVMRGWLAPRPWRLLRAPGKFRELAGYAATLAKARVPYRLGTAVVAAQGADRVESVTTAKVTAQWIAIPGTERTVAVDAVCVTHGFIPRTELAVASGCEFTDDGFVAVGDDQQTSIAGVFAAGEITGIGGVDLALAEGTIAGAAAAAFTGLSARGIAGERKKRAIFTDFAGRIEAAHGIPNGWSAGLSDETIVCRCEEVTSGDLRAIADQTQAQSVRALKLTSRAGLGICQGRMCARSVHDLITHPDSALPTALDHRPIVSPQRLSDLASLADRTHADERE